MKDFLQRTNIYLTKEHVAKLDVIAKSKKVTRSELIRFILKYHLQWTEDQEKIGKKIELVIS